MDDATKREIARKGGIAAHRKGTAHKFTSEEAREAGRKGGMASSSPAQAEPQDTSASPPAYSPESEQAAEAEMHGTAS